MKRANEKAMWAKINAIRLKYPKVCISDEQMKKYAKQDKMDKQHAIQRAKELYKKYPSVFKHYTDTGKKPLTSKKIREFIKDERAACKEYKQYGLKSLAKDECRHKIELSPLSKMTSKQRQTYLKQMNAEPKDTISSRKSKYHAGLYLPGKK